MLNRIALTALVITCTFTYEPIHALGQASTKQIDHKKDLICVLVLSGMQKEDLDPHTLKKLRQHNLDLQSLNNETVRQECYKSKIIESISVDKEPITLNQRKSTPNLEVIEKHENATTNGENQNYDKIVQQIKKIFKNGNITKLNEEKKPKINATSRAMDLNRLNSTTIDKPPVNFNKIIEMYTFLQRQSAMLQQVVPTETMQQNERTNNQEKKVKEYKILPNESNNNDFFVRKSITNSNIHGVDKVFIEQYFSNRNKAPTLTTTDRSEYKTINVLQQLNHFLDSQDEVKLFKQIKSQGMEKPNMGQQSNNINYNALHDYIKQTEQKTEKTNTYEHRSDEYSTITTKSPPYSGEYGSKIMSKLYNIPNNVLQEITNNVRNTILNDLKKESPSQSTQKPFNDNNDQLSQYKFQDILTMLKSSILRDVKKEADNNNKIESDKSNYPFKPANSIDNYPKEITPQKIEAPTDFKDIGKDILAQYQKQPMDNLDYNMFNFHNIYNDKPENRDISSLNNNLLLSSFPVKDKFKESSTDFKSPLQYRTYAETAVYKKYQYNMNHEILDDYVGQSPPLENLPPEFNAPRQVGNNAFSNEPFNMRSFQNYLHNTYTVNATQENRNVNNVLQENNAVPSRPNLIFNGNPYNMQGNFNNLPPVKLNVSTQENGNMKMTDHFQEQTPNFAFYSYPYMMPNSFNRYPPQILHVNTTQIIRNFKSFPTPYEPVTQDQSTKEELFSLKVVENKIMSTISSTTATAATDKPTKSPETNQVLDKLSQLFDQINTLKAKIETPNTNMKLTKTKIIARNYVPDSNALKISYNGPSDSKAQRNDNFRLDPYVDIESSMLNIPSPKFINAMTMQTNCDSIPPLGIPISVKRSPFVSLIENQNIIVQSTMRPYNDDWVNIMPQHRQHAEQNYNPKINKAKPKLHENYEEYYNEYKTNINPLHQKLALLPEARQTPHNYGYQIPSRDPDHYPAPKNRIRNSEADDNYQEQHYYQRPDPENFPAVRLYHKQSQGDSENYPAENYEEVRSKGKKYTQEGKRSNIYRQNFALQKPDDFSVSRERERKVSSREKQARMKVPQRNQIPLKKRPSTYDDTHFKNFLKTQQKVNAMLERILATKVPSSAII